MSCVENLAAFVCRSAYEDLSDTVREQLKIRTWVRGGRARRRTGSDPPAANQRVRIARKCTLIGGGTAAPDSVAFYNGGLVRYLDFNDAYLAKGETCHPSDNLAAILARAE